MTRVRMMTAMAGPAGAAHAGAELDLPPRQARELVNGGYAVDLDKQKAEEAAKAAASRAERLAAEQAKAEAERLAAEQAKAEAERLAAEQAKAEAERLEAEKAEAMESAELRLGETAEATANKRTRK